MRCVCESHVACLHFVFYSGRLAVPQSRHGFTGTPRSFFAPHRDVLLSTEARREEIRMTTMTKQFISFAFVVAFSFLSSKADIDSAQEQYDAEGNLRGIVIHNPTAAIGEGEKQVKTPWMIMTPDGKSAFANDFTKNAISVVSEDGTNYYAHLESEDGDRTKVIHFTVNENGIPSKNGDVIDTTESGEENNAEKMKIRKLIGVNGGYLYFYPINEYSTSLVYNPQTKDVIEETVYNYSTDKEEPERKKYLSLCKDNDGFFVLCNSFEGNPDDGSFINVTSLRQTDGKNPILYLKMYFKGLLPEESYQTTFLDNVYLGDLNGQLYVGKQKQKTAELPGPVSGLSHNYYGDVFATTPATNAFYNVTRGQYNVATDQNGNVKPMIPKTKDGLIKVIDNRHNGGKFLCITTKGAHAIDE